MSKLIVISNPMHDFIDPNFLSQFVAELQPYTLKDAGYKVISTDRYTLDHEHALKQGDNQHASN